MIDRKDLTRWNRASLSRFRYVDGNAIEYLEILRQQLAEKFADPETGRCEWLNPAESVPANEQSVESETLIQRQERLSRRQKRLLESYHQERRDWLWEISRTFARACHILTEHTNAYANEFYLGTATQWDHVRRLVEMLDYHPAPPASAYTPLVLLTKGNKSGIVAKGFQVKYSPPNGGAKIIFETLEDLFVDPALDELRPRGWNRSEEPAVPPPPNGDGSTQPPGDEGKFSSIANGPAINLQGVGDKWALQLDTVRSEDADYFRIRDFRKLDPENPGIILDPEDPNYPFEPGQDPGAEIGAIRLRELKAKAMAISEFEAEPGWSDISDWLLPRIASERSESLMEMTANPLDKVQTLQHRIELIGAFLDQIVYENATLKDLLPPVAGATGSDPQSVASPWRAKRKPKVEPGQVAMVFRESENKAEAATIDSVDESSGEIDLLLDQVDYTWTTWSKGDITLRVAPHWQRECWLNNEGIDVVRTVEPHGLSKDSYVSWKESGEWRFAKVTEVDTRDLRLEVTGSLPQEGDHLYELRPIQDSKFPRDYEAIVLLGSEQDAPPDAENVTPDIEAPLEPDKPEIDSIFTLKKFVPDKVETDGAGAGGGGGGGGLLPPASLPKIGSFLFPSPMLPMDLVKAAVELMLSIGVMVIPSTGEVVIKGMPFGGLLEAAGSDPAKAAQQLFDMLNKLEGTVQECTPDGELLWKLKNGGFAVEDPSVVPGSPGDPYERDNDGQLVPYQIQQTLGGLPLWKLKDGGTGISPVLPPAEIPEDDPFLRNSDGSPVPAHVVKKLVTWEEQPTTNENAGMTNEEKIIEALTNLMSVPEGKEATALFQQLVEDIAGKGPLLAIPKEATSKAIVQASVPLYMFNGTNEKIEVNDWVVGRFTDGLRALKVGFIREFIDEDKTETFSLSFQNLIGNEPELQKVYADFRGELTPEGAAVNDVLIEPPDVIELEDVPDSLRAGRDVLLTADGEEPVAAKIEKVDGNEITTVPPATGFKKGNLVIRGNVVLAGHGETKPEKILGSGDAAKSNQQFILEVEQVSFTPDATKKSGVAAAIEVEVAGRVWEQIATLRDSAPGDHHYAVRMTEEGYVKTVFGDGEYGRRLPSGANNIRVRYRVGAGLAGNVPAGSLEKPVNPHPLVDKVLQPMHAAGGSDMESLSSLRTNAPSTLLALERAVSLSDFSHLAASQSSIWQANAFSEIQQGERMESVKVVIVPAGGVISAELKDEITRFLEKHALLGVRVRVAGFDSELFDLDVTVRVNSEEFLADEVVNEVASALLTHFRLQHRKLGQSVYLSEVYKIVESIQGVENAICILNSEKSLQAVKASSESAVVYLDPDAVDEPSKLRVRFEEYRP